MPHMPVRRNILILAITGFLALDKFLPPGSETVALAGEATPEALFLAENKVAMSRMMSGMDVEPSGDVDRDFVEMMTAHHRGAIEMAQAELRHGRNEYLRRISQGIVVEQQQEIAAMQRALVDGPSARKP